MKLKCIECQKEAVYIFEGFSVCEDHLKELKERTAQTKEKMAFMLQKANERLQGSGLV